MKALATTVDLQNILKTYILTKLDQKALSNVNENAATIDEIIEALKGKILSKTSKVLEGQMIALTLENKSLIDFQKQAEEISKNYQLSLFEEEIPLAIAEKLTIEKTVDLCRKNTRSSEVIAILLATAPFHSGFSNLKNDYPNRRRAQRQINVKCQTKQI